jgi:hypothetical protein
VEGWGVERVPAVHGLFTVKGGDQHGNACGLLHIDLNAQSPAHFINRIAPISATLAHAGQHSARAALVERLPSLPR